MPIEAPNVNQVKNIAASFGMDLSDADAASFAGLMKGIAKSYDRLDAMVEPKPEVKYSARDGRATGAAGKPVRRLGLEIDDHGRVRAAFSRARRSP